MDWIKRNLYFLIGSVVALILMGLAGFYFYSKLQLNNEIMVKLDEQYAELQRLSGEKPHPGYGQVNNIEAAEQQEQQVQEMLNKTRTHFVPIPAIPDAPKVTSQEYSASLRRTIDQLQRQATNASVSLPPNYSFAFEAQKPRVTFAAGSLEPLAAQLGEVKVICDILFAAKINSIENIRRERVSADDSTGPQTDYLEQKSTTNALAVMTPYEISFRCFSSELAAALAGFGGSPHGILVKTINVEAVGTNAPSATEQFNPEMPVQAPSRATGAEAAFARRYGGAEMPGGRYGGGAEMAARYGGGAEAAAARRYGGAEMPGGAARGGIALRPLGSGAQPGMAPVYAAPAAQSAAAPSRGGLPTVLDEKQLNVTMTLQIVKLLPKDKDKDKAKEQAGENPNPANPAP